MLFQLHVKLVLLYQGKNKMEWRVLESGVFGKMYWL